MSEAYEIDFIPPNDYKEYWQTKDFQLIKYCDMTDKHLLNAHRMIANKLVDFTNYCINRNEELEPPQWVQNAIEGLETELDKRGLLK